MNHRDHQYSNALSSACPEFSEGTQRHSKSPRAQREARTALSDGQTSMARTSFGTWSDDTGKPHWQRTTPRRAGEAPSGGSVGECERQMLLTVSAAAAWAMFVSLSSSATWRV